MIAYLDASALVKLVAAEPESGALSAELDRWPRQASAEIARVEVLRAVRIASEELVADARAVLAKLVLIRASRAIQDDAATLEPLRMRSLDALHVASARALGSDLGALISYDKRMLAAAQSAGLPTAAPR